MLSGALLEATALIHLLDVVDRLRVVLIRRMNRDRPEIAQRHSGPKIEQPPAATQEPVFALEVALLADGLAQLRREVLWIDNGIILALGRRSRDVQLAGAVTALAADGRAAKDRFFVSIQI